VPCNSTPKDVFDGAGNQQIDTWGASAWIVTRDAGLCTGIDPLGFHDFIVAWSMVTNYWVDKYAQAGYLKYQLPGDDTWHPYSEYSDVGCQYGYCRTVDFTVPLAQGSNTQYWVVYSSDSHKIEMWYSTLTDGQWYNHRIDWTSFDPTDPNGGHYWQGPWYEQYAGETRNPGNDVPGSASYKASFTSVAIWPGSTPWNGEDFPPPFANIDDYPGAGGAANRTLLLWQQYRAQHFQHLDRRRLQMTVRQDVARKSLIALASVALLAAASVAFLSQSRAAKKARTDWYAISKKYRPAPLRLYGVKFKREPAPDRGKAARADASETVTSPNQAISAALPVSGTQTAQGTVLQNVSATAQYGLFSDPAMGEQTSAGFKASFVNLPSWIVTFSGPGISLAPIVPSGDPHPPTGMHSEENFVVDDATGKVLLEFD